jgi:hypothetical protein
MVNFTWSLGLNTQLEPKERHGVLYYIEQGQMPKTGKRYEWEVAVMSENKLAATFQDFDWADEVLHAQIGRRALKREQISPQEAADRAKSIHEKTWAALEQYRNRGRQENWWPEFVRKTLGRDSAVADKQDLGPINIFSE